MMAQPPCCRDGLQRGNIARASHHDIWLNVLLVARPMPRGEATSAVIYGLLHGKPLQLWLLINHNQVHVVTTAETMIGNREETIGIRWQIDASNRPLLGKNRVEQARPLVAEAIVVIAPAGR